ncbi:MAG: M24 family metallopeptidase [Candidatus Aenigmarchaeota archaeon]|nr:M24 family metallopeptidase [Candidatus Aenigmarchaeota archaeon]NIP40401.1 M24 family metallopeptidase [Candidatus Aenigmarchaeota archaeon]NIQ18327.1 M24 family metallopeptidase [Candidatus Aenigmarchaeota archaeon]NIS73279.1 M24 family metallopeptidase [Candidatus Aenigmarchaeota archaeon]
MKPNFSARQRKLRKLMKNKGIDALLISNNDDIYYYTGYTGLREDRIFTIFPRDDKPKLIVSPLENEAKAKYPNTILIERVKDFMNLLMEYKTLGYDEKRMNVLLFKELEKSKIKPKPFGKFLEIPRITKGEWEIEQIKRAIRITKKVFGSLGKLPGKTEMEISNEIDILFRKHGVTNAFENIVSSGPQGAYVHHKPNKRIIKTNDVVLIDIGCKFNGYCSDIARVFCKKSGKKERKIYEDAKEIHNEIADNVRAGVRYKDIDNIQRRLFRKKSYDVVHAFGHGVGLTVHDPIGNILKENMVLTVEPGIYVKNIGGFRIEDMVLVRRGKARLLSRSIPLQ